MDGSTIDLPFTFNLSTWYKEYDRNTSSLEFQLRITNISTTDIGNYSCNQSTFLTIQVSRKYFIITTTMYVIGILLLVFWLFIVWLSLHLQFVFDLWVNYPFGTSRLSFRIRHKLKSNTKPMKKQEWSQLLRKRKLIPLQVCHPSYCSWNKIQLWLVIWSHSRIRGRNSVAIICTCLLSYSITVD